MSMVIFGIVVGFACGLASAYAWSRLPFVRSRKAKSEAVPPRVPETGPSVWGEELQHGTKRHDAATGEISDEEYVRRVATRN
jgi:hypothetical protein